MEQYDKIILSSLATACFMLLLFLAYFLGEKHLISAVDTIQSYVCD